MNTFTSAKLISFFLLGIVVSVPLLFGAVHPIVAGLYVFFILVVFGSWLLYTFNTQKNDCNIVVFWLIIPLLIITYLALQAIPLPLNWLEFLSPQRGERLRILNNLAGTTIQFAPLSESGPLGFHKAILYLAALLFYFTLCRLLKEQPAFQQRLVYCLIALGTIEALYGLFQFLKPQIGILWLPNPERAAHGTIIYKNQYASMLNMIWPLAVAVAIGDYWGRPRRKSRKRPWLAERIDALTKVPIRAPLCLFASILMMLAVLFSLSRGGILSMVIAMLALMLLLPMSLSRKFGASMVILALLGGYGLFLGFDTVVARFGAIDQSGTHRISIYLNSLPMIMDHWMIGIGMGSYSLLSPIYLKGFPLGTMYDSAHNEYLELTIELGIPVAAILFVWIFAGIFRLLVGINVWRTPPPTGFHKHVMAVAALSALIGFLAHGMVDFGWRLPANLIYSTTLLALCISSIQSEPTSAAATVQAQGTI